MTSQGKTIWLCPKCGSRDIDYHTKDDTDDNGRPISIDRGYGCYDCGASRFKPVRATQHTITPSQARFLEEHERLHKLFNHLKR